MRFAVVCIVASAVAASITASADEGRIPLFEPTTITESGHYVVTNDFEAASGPAIRVEALDVTIDLNGHTVRGDVVTAPTYGEHHLWLMNGRVVGQLAKSFTGAAPLSAVDPMLLRLTNVTGVGGGIYFDPCWGFDVRDSRIDGAVFLNGNTGNITAHLLDSTVQGVVEISGLTKSVIRGTSFGSDLSLSQGDGFSSEENVIENNAIHGRLKLRDAHGGVDSAHNLARANLAGAIDVQGDANHVTGNSVRNGSITVDGSRNVIDGNSVQGPGFGLVLNGNNNVWRNNILHNNTAGSVQNNGTGNVNAGGNVN